MDPPSCLSEQQPEQPFVPLARKLTPYEERAFRFTLKIETYLQEAGSITTRSHEDPLSSLIEPMVEYFALSIYSPRDPNNPTVAKFRQSLQLLQKHFNGSHHTSSDNHSTIDLCLEALLIHPHIAPPEDIDRSPVNIERWTHLLETYSSADHGAHAFFFLCLAVRGEQNYKDPLCFWALFAVLEMYHRLLLSDPSESSISEHNRVEMALHTAILPFLAALSEVDDIGQLPNPYASAFQKSSKLGMQPHVWPALATQAQKRFERFFPLLFNPDESRSWEALELFLEVVHFDLADESPPSITPTEAQILLACRCLAVLQDLMSPLKGGLQMCCSPGLSTAQTLILLEKCINMHFWNLDFPSKPRVVRMGCGFYIPGSGELLPRTQSKFWGDHLPPLEAFYKLEQNGAIQIFNFHLLYFNLSMRSRRRLLKLFLQQFLPEDPSEIVSFLETLGKNVELADHPLEAREILVEGAVDLLLLRVEEGLLKGNTPGLMELLLPKREVKGKASDKPSMPLETFAQMQLGVRQDTPVLELFPLALSRHLNSARIRIFLGKRSFLKLFMDRLIMCNQPFRTDLLFEWLYVTFFTFRSISFESEEQPSNDLVKRAPGVMAHCLEANGRSATLLQMMLETRRMDSKSLQSIQTANNLAQKLRKQLREESKKLKEAREQVLQLTRETQDRKLEKEHLEVVVQNLDAEVNRLKTAMDKAQAESTEQLKKQANDHKRARAESKRDQKRKLDELRREHESTQEMLKTKLQEESERSRTRLQELEKKQQLELQKREKAFQAELEVLKLEVERTKKTMAHLEAALADSRSVRKTEDEEEGRWRRLTSTTLDQMRDPIHFGLAKTPCILTVAGKELLGLSNGIYDFEDIRGMLATKQIQATDYERYVVRVHELDQPLEFVRSGRQHKDTSRSDTLFVLETTDHLIPLCSRIIHNAKRVASLPVQMKRLQRIQSEMALQLSPSSLQTLQWDLATPIDVRTGGLVLTSLVKFTLTTVESACKLCLASCPGGGGGTHVLLEKLPGQTVPAMHSHHIVSLLQITCELVNVPGRVDKLQEVLHALDVNYFNPQYAKPRTKPHPSTAKKDKKQKEKAPKGDTLQQVVTSIHQRLTRPTEPSDRLQIAQTVAQIHSLLLDLLDIAAEVLATQAENLSKSS